MDIWFLTTIFMLSCFIGYFVIWRVTPSLHAPLMSVSNAISGIIIVGGIISLENAQSQIAIILSYLAIFLASINIFGGFAISQKMLNMFNPKRKK